MKLENSQISNVNESIYVSPLIEIIEVKNERGFAASNGENESWNEIPGGGEF